MAETKTQVKPQFILYVPESGIFKSAELKMPDAWFDATYDLTRNSQIGNEDISPSSLELVASAYLGPVRIFEELSDGILRSKEVLQVKRNFRRHVVYDIVKLAEGVAKSQGAPYFTVINAQSPVERTWKFSEKEDLLGRRVREADYIVKKIQEVPKPIEFVLHPTAQLYVPRK